MFSVAVFGKGIFLKINIIKEHTLSRKFVYQLLLNDEGMYYDITKQIRHQL